MEIPESLRRRYRFEALLGQGGFGAVLGCQDLKLGRTVALKLMHGLDPELAARFDREARVTASLSHPNIVKVYDYGVSDEGVPWIAYEQVEGRDLCKVATPDEATLQRWAHQGAQALAAVHATGLVHRDVKPANFLLRKDTGDLVLVDFGIVRSESRATVATAEGLILGTPGFMAPELFAGEPPSAASDQYAWATTLAGIALGRPLVPEASPGESMALVLSLDPQKAVPSEAGSPAFVAALRRGLALDPHARFADMQTFAAALVEAADAPPSGNPQAGETQVVSAGPPAPGQVTPQRGTTASSRPWQRFGLLTAGLLGLGIVSAVGLPSAPPAPSPPPPPSVPTRDPAKLQRLVAAYQKAAAQASQTDQEVRNRVRLESEGNSALTRDLRVYAAPDRVLALKRSVRALGELIVELDHWPPATRASNAPGVYLDGSTLQTLTFELEDYRARTVVNALMRSRAIAEDPEFHLAFSSVQQRQEELRESMEALRTSLQENLPEPSGAAQALLYLTSLSGLQRNRPLDDDYSSTSREFLTNLRAALDASPLPPDTPPLARRLVVNALLVALQRSRDMIPCADLISHWIPRLPSLVPQGLEVGYTVEIETLSLLVEIKLRAKCDAEFEATGAAALGPRLRRLVDKLTPEVLHSQAELPRVLRELASACGTLAGSGLQLDPQLLLRLRKLSRRPPSGEAP